MRSLLFGVLLSLSGCGAVSVKNKSEARILDFSATWCQPCVWMDINVWPDKYVVEEVAKYSKFEKIDNDIRPDLIKIYNIKLLPTVMIVDKSGREIKRIEKLRNAKEIVDFLK